MLEKTRGIVLQSFKYGETSLICHIYTYKYGRKAFIIKGLRGNKNKHKANLFQSLFILDIEYYHKENKELLLIKEFNDAKHWIDFPYNPIKSTQVMFIAEVLSKVLIEEEANSKLFNFLSHSVEYFDLQNSSVSNFHLIFLMKLTYFLGILPRSEILDEKIIFDLKEGIFINHIPLHKEYTEENLSRILYQFHTKNYDQNLSLPLSQNSRNKVLDEIIKFYSFHNYNLNNLKSLQVLRELF